MKLTTFAAGIGLALAPALGMAQSVTPSTDTTQNTTVEPGGVSQTGTEGLPLLSTIPAGAVVVGGVVIVAGVAVGIVAATDEGDSVSATTTTN